MVGHHPVAGLERPVRGLAGDFGRRQDQRPQRIGIVIIMLALQDRGEPLQPQPGVDRGPRQVRAGAGRPLLILHEHQVPDLDEAVAVLFRAAWRPAGDLRPVVVENLRTRPARPGVAHPPEIIRRRDPDDLLVRQPGDFLPQIGGGLVVVINRGQQLVLRQGKVLGQQGPGVVDRLLLEIIAERKIPQHLEKRVVPRGVPHIVEIVMLAAGPHAFLRRGGAGIGPLLLPGENVLELHHPGIGEQQGWVVFRHQRGARHNLVAVAGEVA